MAKKRGETIDEFIDSWRSQGKKWPIPLKVISDWACEEGYEPHQRTKQALAAQEFADRMRAKLIRDPQGRDVRPYLALRLPEEELSEFEIYGIEQTVLWLDIRTDEPSKVKIAFQQLREGILDSCVKLMTEVESYNDNRNKRGEPIQLSIDFGEDYAELKESTIYAGL